VRWLAPAALAVVFAAAGGAKLVDRETSVPRAISVAEIAVAVLLIAVPPVGAALALGLLAGFTVALVVRIRRGSEEPCECFGQLGTRPVSWLDVARNLGFMALAAVALVWPPA
jgi:hypothetical protein